MIEYRAVEGVGTAITGNKLAGYAARFGVPAELGEYEEVIQRGAFKASLKSKTPVPLLVGHDQARAIARSPRTMRLSEDGEGLYFDAELPDTQEARDLRTLIDGGVLDGMSFGFLTTKESWHGVRRTLHEVRLVEISVVAVPAYPDTSVALRNRQIANRDPLWAYRKRLVLHELKELA